MAHHVYERLRSLKYSPQYIFHKDEHVMRDLQFLQDHGYIGLKPLLSELKEGENLAERIELTACGHMFVESRENYEKECHNKNSHADKE